MDQPTPMSTADGRVRIAYLVVIVVTSALTCGEPRLFLRVEVTESFQTLFPYPFVSNPITLRRQAELRVY